MTLGSHTHHSTTTTNQGQMLSPEEAHLSSATTRHGMDGSDVKALSIVVGIPDLAHIYMEPTEPTETANRNLHDSGLSCSSQLYYKKPAPAVETPTDTSQPSHYQASHGWE